MEVSTSYCSGPGGGYKYGSYQSSDDVTMVMDMLDDDDTRFAATYADVSFSHDGSIYEDETASSYDIGGEPSETVISFEDDMDMSEESEDMDETEEEDWTNQKNQSNVSKTSVSYCAGMEMLRIRFPFQSIVIRISDFCCLQEQDLLNDTMIDFYLNHIVEHILPDHLGRKVTVLPSVFWHNLSLRQHSISSEDENNMTEQQKLDEKFGDLHEFVADFDLQDVDYIVVPVNEWEHWSLAVICHPFTERAQLVIFDSQLSSDYNDLANMAQLMDSFMKYSWMKRTGVELAHSLNCFVPLNLPQQENSFDCGVFVVEFARRFLLAPPENLDTFDFGTTYSDFCVAGKRLEMQRAVLSLCSDRSMWIPLVNLLNGINTAVPHRAI